MNLYQKAAIACGLIAVVLMGLCPPWDLKRDAPDRTTGYIVVHSLGYGSIFDPPPTPDPPLGRGRSYGPYYYRQSVDVTRLIVQEAVALIATAGLVVLLRSGQAPVQKEGGQ